MHLFYFCGKFGGLVSVSMLRSVILDLNVVLMPNLLPILLNFSDIPGAYGIIAYVLWLIIVLVLRVFVYVHFVGLVSFSRFVLFNRFRLQWRYCPVYVGFLYMMVVTSSLFLFTRISIMAVFLCFYFQLLNTSWYNYYNFNYHYTFSDCYNTSNTHTKKQEFKKGFNLNLN